MLNPLKSTKSIQRNYLSFFQTSLAPNNPDLKRKIAALQSKGLLWREPYLAVSQYFKKGRPLENFIKIANLSPILKEAFTFENLHLHQESAIQNILNSNNTIIASGTGSGKTEIFFIPILDYCIKNRDEGIKVIIVYPMNALANDQVDRLRNVLFPINQKLDKPITFGIYTGQTPENTSLEEFKQMAAVPYTCPHCNRDTLTVSSNGSHSYLQCSKDPEFKIDFQKITRKEIRESLPDILITNYVQLEYLLLRKQDDSLFQNGTIHFVVMDELHAYGGARGIDVSLLIRRLKRRLKKDKEIVFIGTSATLSKSEDLSQRKSEIAEFAKNLVGATIRSSDVFEGIKEEWHFDESVMPTKLLTSEDVAKLNDQDQNTLTHVCKILNPNFIVNTTPDKKMVANLLLKNKFFQDILKLLEEPRDILDISAHLREIEEFRPLISQTDDLEDIIWNYLLLGTLVPNPEVDGKSFLPLIRVNVHNFFKSIDPLFSCSNCNKLFSVPINNCDECSSIVEQLGVCRFCGKEFLVSSVLEQDIFDVMSEDSNNRLLGMIEEIANKTAIITRLDYSQETASGIKSIWQSVIPIPEAKKMNKCMKCGSLLNEGKKICDAMNSNQEQCNSKNFRTVYLVSSVDDGKIRSPSHQCPFCGNSYGRSSALSETKMSPNTASVTFFDSVFSEIPAEIRKMLIFTDNRQAASQVAGILEDEHLSHTIRSLLYKLLKSDFDGKTSLVALRDETMFRIRSWYHGDIESFGLSEREIERSIDEELTSYVGKQRSLENLGIIEVNYNKLETLDSFKKLLEINFFKSNNISINDDAQLDLFRKYLISLLSNMRNQGAFSSLTIRQAWEKENPVGYYSSRDRSTAEEIPRIKYKNILRGKPLVFTKKVFGVNEKEAEDIIDESFEFLKKCNYIILRILRHGRRELEAHVVNDKYTIVKLPTEIFRCSRCIKIFSNVPNNQCPTWRCDGEVKLIDYNEFSSDPDRGYYFQKYTTSDPIRMVTKEDTGALDQDARRKIEIDFKQNQLSERRVDVVVATPTLELGVDIGDLFCVGLHKTPPSPVNYLQRVGRSGRKHGISFVNTFMFPNPIDVYYYRKPDELIRGEVRPPFVNLENRHMVQRHANAVILEDLLVDSPKHHLFPEKLSEFVKNNADQILLKETIERKKIIFSKIKETFSSLPITITDDIAEEMIEQFRDSVKKSIQKYHMDLERYRRRDEIIKQQLRETSEPGLHRYLRKRILDVGDMILKLEKERRVLMHFMETGVLPRYAFPGLYVDVEDEFGQNSFAGRSRNVAITEYAPGMEFYAMKKIYKSAGVDYKSAKPDKQSFFICESCNKYIKNENFDFCQLCKKKIHTKEITAIAPDLIYLNDTRKRINEPRDYQEPLLEIYLDIESDKGNKKFDNILLTKYGNIPIFEVVSSIRISDSRTPVPIEICSKCGRGRGEFTDTKHKTLGNYKEFCNGEFEQLGIYHQMPTNVISLRIIDERLFGIPINEVAPNREVFLTTLKNAIINGAQLIVQAEDGEIDGVVKDNEIILFDNIEGGVGYVDEIFRKFGEIIVQAADIILGESETFEEECVSGCPKCLWSYRRKRDIPLIDKRTIVPFLKAAQVQIAENTIFKNEERVNTYITKEVRTVHSPAYDFAGVLDLKQIIRSAKKEIKLTSLYVTDSKIDWPDEGSKSWVDILSSVKHGPNNVSITVIVKEPQSPAHKFALRRLKESGVIVKVYKKEIEQILPAIVHSKLIVVDPQNKENRHAIHTSGNFSPEMWKNHETFDFGTAENWVNGTHQEILKLENESRSLEDADVYVAEGITTISIKPDEVSEEIEKVSQEIGKIETTILIMDPYLGNLEKFFEYLTKWLKRGTEIKIVTSRVSSKDIEKIKEKYLPLGYKIGLIRYLDRDKKDGRETILHDRYLILDNKKVVLLGKGINTLVESAFRKAKDNVIIQILEIPSEVRKYSDDFTEFWNPELSKNDTIKNFPKDVFK